MNESCTICLSSPLHQLGSAVTSSSDMCIHLLTSVFLEETIQIVAFSEHLSSARLWIPLKGANGN